ncbi:uncharacterized protein EDB93DRAFT_1253727 [Suillus bovinus]|uniref:uncharacterized protein n=1 Tax=Suillus bovinus TaxID=48563 RepID=UPI001B880EAA|nr:uncharacterized protein EDB93DRAFT_1253727 [Suillus bovinus]KAG2137113.1 hypothetical protein EDB93DRAFT_1253727 [Suillus bovinus]
MAEAQQPFVLITTPVGAFEARECAVSATAMPDAHECAVSAVAIFPDRRHMVTGLGDRTLCLWDLKTGVIMKKMEGHRAWVGAVAVSRDGQLIASGDANGELIEWDGNTGESLTQPIRVHSKQIVSLDFSPTGTVLASGSWDTTTKLWSTGTWQMHGNAIDCSDGVHCVRHSPSGEYLAIATSKDVQIWTTGKRECIAHFQSHAALDPAWNYSLAWTPDGTRLLSGSNPDPTIQEWDTSTWKQVGDPGKSHIAANTITGDPTASFVASASTDHPRLQRLSDRRTIAIFKHSNGVYSDTYSTYGKHIPAAGKVRKSLDWSVLEDSLVNSKILTMNMAIRNACVTGDLHIAEALLTRQIYADHNDYNAYANRSFVRARQADWDRALDDALKSISLQHSLTGWISKGIALCGKMQIQDAMEAFDLAFMFTNEYSKTTHILLLIKARQYFLAIAYFNAYQHEHAILRIQKLANVCPKADIPVCHIVEGINAFDGAYENEAADHLTVIINTIALTSQGAIHSKYEDLVVLFGWDLKQLWQIASQKRCDALLHAGRLREAHESYRYMMDVSDEATKASCLVGIAFKQRCSALYAVDGDALVTSGNAAFDANNYDKAIELYSVAIDLDFATEAIFANRSKAWLEKLLWEDALLDAEKVIKLDPASYLGYELKHAAMHGTQRYDEAIEAFQVMLSKLDNSADTQLQDLRRQHLSSSEAEAMIEKTIYFELECTPLRLLNTSAGRLCDREAQINAFKMSTEYKELLSSTMKHADLCIARMEEVVAEYFGYVMLSHRWEESESLLRDIQDKDVYELSPIGGIVKLQSFCKTAHTAGYRWGWIDTCCIDKSNNIEFQESINSMFAWYHHSALTIVYLPDVLPSSKPGAMAKSSWNTRGWTVPELLAPKTIRFYQNDWTLYLNDRTPNHKHSDAIMQELEEATSIDPQELVAFRPGMRDAREKLRWASMRATTVQEDVAYSLFGIFGISLPVMYGETKQNALGRLLQEIVAQSGDLTALDWVGKSSRFNSCLPTDITSYATLPYTLPFISEEEMEISVSSLKNTVVVELAMRLYSTLNSLAAPRFYRCRLQLPCITFPVTEVRRRPAEHEETLFTYTVKADGLHDLKITTEDKLLQFSRGRPTRQSFFLVRPWDRRLLGLPEFLDDVQSVDDWSEIESLSSSSSPGEKWGVRSESHSQALQLLFRLGLPFPAFLLAQQRGGEYKRIASDRYIIAQVQDVASVHAMMDVRILDIL